MYLFQDKEEIAIKINCKLCLKEIEFYVSIDEYKKIQTFPFKMEYIHGEPAHKLVVYINKALEIENFEIEEALQQEVSYSKELTHQVLSEIDLNDDEIELYFLTTGRDAVSAGEMALLVNKSKEECEKIAKKFVDKGLFKEIIGATPHYRALPPYAALLGQLQKFHSYISEIKTKAPIALKKSFTALENKAEGIKQLQEYIDFIIELKNTVLKKLYDQKGEFGEVISGIDEIKGITKDITDLEGQTKEILVEQIKDLTSRFGGIYKKIGETLKGQIQGITKNVKDNSEKISKIVTIQIQNLAKQLENTKATISNNIQKLRLGVIQETVDQVIQQVFDARINEVTHELNFQLNKITMVTNSNLKIVTNDLKNQLEVIKKIFTEGLKSTVASFNDQFLTKLKNSILNVVTNVDEITTSTSKSSENIKTLFADISKNFSLAINQAEEKVGGISDTVFESFGNLRETFSSSIITTLNDELDKILKQLEISEITTREFWEQERKTSLFTMKDIWFIRSPEGVKAHINDELLKAKMRVLIVAPQINDVDINVIKKCRQHVNIRISASFNPSDPNHLQFLQEIDELTNVDFRHRELQNLWGINRESEVVILCVVSETEDSGKQIIEIGGIGSIIPEHIKIFVPILEDAWIGSRKDVRSVIKKPAVKRVSVQPLKPRATPTPKVIKTQESKVLQPKTQEVMKTGQVSPKITPVKEVASLPSNNEKISETDGNSLIENDFQAIKDNMEKISAIQLSDLLQKLHDDISEIKGYSSVLKPISLSINNYVNLNRLLTPIEGEKLLKMLTFWRKKLNM